MLHVHNFQFGLLTPVASYLISCLGAFLGLRCTTRARACSGAVRARWLLLAAVSIGSTGVWAMHFIAMLGFAIPGETIRYDVPVAIISMLITVVVVGIGLLIVGFSRGGWVILLIAGFITGIGVASMHYTGMEAMRMPARMTYSPVLFALSVLIAIVAATAALWAAVRLHRVLSTLGAALIMGVAVSGMHYTDMAAMHVYSTPGMPGMSMGGATALGFLPPLAAGIAIVTFILVATIGMSPTAEEIAEEIAMLERCRARGLPI
ncbi:MAG: MHYT domain-containing protein [Streptosporangiaceae bacterium]